MLKNLIGQNEDGTPRYNYVYDGPEGGGVLKTGPVSATIALKDGTVYDLTDEFIEHAPGHAGPICHHIEKLHVRAGRLAEHVCTDMCGDEADNKPEAVEAPVEAPAEAPVEPGPEAPAPPA